MPHVPPELVELATSQSGLLTTSQALTFVTPDALRWALRTRWRSVHPGVLSTSTGELTPGRRLVAAALYAGEGAQLASLSAVRWHGLHEAPDDGVVRFLVPWSRSSRRTAGVVVQRTSRPDPRPWHRGPLTVCSPARATVDAARVLRGDDVRAVVIEAVQRRLVTVEQLSHQVEDGPRRGSAEVRAAVVEAGGGVWSLPEAELLDLVAETPDLPTPWTNPELRDADGSPLPSPDLWFDEVGLAVQVHSRRHHFLEADWQWTLRSDTSLGTAGVPVLAFTPRDLRSQRSRVREAIQRAYGQLRRAGRRPHVVATRRGVRRPGGVGAR